MRCGAILLACSAGATAQTAPPAAVHPLHDGEHLVLQGRLRPNPQGRLQFMTVRTAEGFLVPGREAVTLHALALAGSIDYERLYRHRNEPVTVSGTVSLDDASPYYLHGVRFTVKSILTNGGEELAGYAAATPIPTSLRSYTATATLPADLAAPWMYRIAGHAEAQRGWLSCSSNGGGDVINCFCAEAFHATAASGPGSEKARLFPGDRMAQFAVGDAARKAELHVTCTR